MKVNGRWVAWMAALALAATLAATPREGAAAGPYRMPDPVPHLGDPDVPTNGMEIHSNQLRITIKGFLIIVRFGVSPNLIILPSPGKGNPQHARRI